MSRDAALIETVRVIGGLAPLWPLHVERLEEGARALRITLSTLDRPSGGADRVVRFEVSSHGVRVSDREVGSSGPIALSTSQANHRGYPYKVTDRAWLDAAGMIARAHEADDALLLDVDGLVVEASIWAIGWWEGERLVFPPLALGGLQSVARRRLGEIVRGGTATAELRGRALHRVPLVACNAARGLVPVVALDGYAVPANHRTAAVARRFWERPDA